LEENINMDRIDDKILTLLQNDGRLPNKQLAAAVGLAPSSCLERVRRLQDRRIIKGFKAIVEPNSLGIGLQAFIAVRLEQHSRDMVSNFRDHIITLSEVVAIYHLAGQEDFIVHVAVKDAEHLRNLTLDAFTTRAEVSRLTTSLVYEYLQSDRLPNYNIKNQS
jgi:DNA-binding Lrp family transcriptional regulator